MAAMRLYRQCLSSDEALQGSAIAAMAAPTQHEAESQSCPVQR